MERLLRIKEVADILNVSRRSVERMIRNGQLESVKIPTGRRVREKDIEGMINKMNKKVCTPDIGVDAGLAKHGL